jgi:copper resistance protein D
LDVGVWDAAAVLVKAALYAATLGAAGGIFFLHYGGSLLEPDDHRAIVRLSAALAAAAIAASAARVLTTAGSMSEDPAGMLDPRLLAMVWHGGEGRATVLRIGGLLFAVGVAAHGGCGRWPASAGAALGAVSFASVGHVHAAARAAPSVLLAVHVLAAAFWLGALAPLLMLARRREPRALGAIAERFGRIALGVVGALLVAGAAALWLLLGSLSALWTSAYGRIACAKIALAACLLALAAWNKLALVPRTAAGDPLAVRRLRRSILAEMGVAGTLLLVTAALTTLAGPPSMP